MTQRSGGARVVFGFLLLALLVGASWLVIRGIEKDPALVGSLVTAMSAVIAVSVGRTMEKRAELKQVHREQMEEAAKFWQGFAGRMILYGPAGVIKAQLALSRQLEANAGSTDPNVPTMLRLEELYRAIRSDLGHTDRHLDVGDLLRLYITDTDALLGPFIPPPMTRAELAVIDAQSAGEEKEERSGDGSEGR